MLYVTDYKELVTGGRNLAENISDTGIEYKGKIIDYMKNGRDYGVRCSSIYDYIEDCSKLKTIKRYTDGIYIWNDEEIYHFEKYNIALNEDFINHVINES